MTGWNPVATATGGNACRFCFAPIEGWDSLYCGDGCRKADRVRPDKGALGEILQAHRDDEPTEPDFEAVELWP